MIILGYSREVSSTSAVAAKNPTGTTTTGVSKQYALAAKIQFRYQWNGKPLLSEVTTPRA